MKKRLPYLIFILSILILDQLSKRLIALKLSHLSVVEVIPGFFNLTHIRNRGAIFGFLSQSASPVVHYLLMLASLVALILVVYYFFKTPPEERLLEISFSLIMAGALGNLLDRLFRGYVIDFLDFYVNKWHWPSFNISDASVSIGAIFLIYILFFGRKL